MVEAYQKLRVPKETLTLIPSQFDTPQPWLEPVVFDPEIVELPSPAMDLFDLDTHLSNDLSKLAQLTNKCTNSDPEFCIIECGNILGVACEIPLDKQTNAKAIMAHILRSVIDYKKPLTLRQQEQRQLN
eukprot:Clim_evm74s144 gene=Clim_evmTU74s144